MLFGETQVEVRVIAAGGKFLGDDIAGARVTLRDVESGALLADGAVMGGSGNVQQIMQTPRLRGVAIPIDGASVFRTTLQLTEPRLVEVAAYGPLGSPQSARRVAFQQWIAPGRHLVGADGIVAEIPGLLVQITSPPTHHQVTAPRTVVQVRANVGMMCGCPIEGTGTVWPQERFEVSALVAVSAGGVWRPVQVQAMRWTGQPSQFQAEWTLPEYGFYQITVFARERGSANTGVDRVTVFCPPPTPPAT